MGRPEEVANLKRSGFSLIEIARELHITSGSVRQYLGTAIPFGLIQGSEVISSIPADDRGIIEAIIQETNSTYWYDIYKHAQDYGQTLDQEELKLYLGYRNSLILMKEMYEYISNIEVTLHRAIKDVLIAKFGLDLWWHDGIPQQIRIDCAKLREEDQEPGHELYCYTNFIQLREILDKQWTLFSDYLPKETTHDKRLFLGKFYKLNHIRNKVMHPVKEIFPTEEEFVLAKEFYQTIQPCNWQSFPCAINQNAG